MLLISADPYRLARISRVQTSPPRRNRVRLHVYCVGVCRCVCVCIYIFTHEHTLCPLALSSCPPALNSAPKKKKNQMTEISRFHVRSTTSGPRKPLYTSYFNNNLLNLLQERMESKKKKGATIATTIYYTHTCVCVYSSYIINTRDPCLIVCCSKFSPNDFEIK